MSKPLFSGTTVVRLAFFDAVDLLHPLQQRVVDRRVQIRAAIFVARDFRLHDEHVVRAEAERLSLKN